MRYRVDRRSGFTLLEVMVAMAILAGSLALILQSQTHGVLASNRSKLMTTATLLARGKLVALEDKLYEEGFSDIDQDDSGDFEEEGFGAFRWTWKVEKVELPSTADLQSAGTASGGASSAAGALGLPGAQGASAGTIDAATQAVLAEFDLIRGVLEGAVRKATLTVLWNEGSREQKLELQVYFTDPTKVDAAMGGMGLGGGQPGLPGVQGAGAPPASGAVRR